MNKDTWIGKVVSFDSQADQVTGQGWGWRYKVRIMGDYSEQDGIEDRDVVYACLLYTSPSPRDKRQSRMPSSA